MWLCVTLTLYRILSRFVECSYVVNMKRDYSGLCSEEWWPKRNRFIWKLSFVQIAICRNLFEGKCTKYERGWAQVVVWWIISRRNWFRVHHMLKEWCQNSRNLHSLDVLACNSANKPSFQKGLLSDFKNMVYWLNHRLKCPEVAILASFLWGNLKETSVDFV